MLSPDRRAAVLAHVRHELRTPLNAIIGYSEMLIEVARDEGRAEALADLERVHRSGRALLSTVNELIRPQRHVLDAQIADLGGFGARVRHALRTPLTDVLGYCELLLEESEEVGHDAYVDDLRRIERAGRELLALIERLPQLAEQAADEPTTLGRLATSRPPRRTRAPEGGRILVADDTEANRHLLERRLAQQGYEVVTVADGEEALERLAAEAFDVVLLDVHMPKLGGFEVLERLRYGQHRRIPVILLSANDDPESVVRGIEMGAEDYLAQPFAPIVLRARISASLERKWLRDQEEANLARIEAEQERSEKLLLNILPQPIAARLKGGEESIAEHHPDVTVLFSDLVGFSTMSARMAPAALVGLLNQVFTAFDRLATRHGLEKIKTIGDAYMVVGGLPEPRHDHADAVAAMALDMRDALASLAVGESLQLRIGVHTGPVVAGVIGRHKFAYDLWGDTVNVASRMESHGAPGQIQLTRQCAERLGPRFVVERRGVVNVRGLGPIEACWLQGRRA